METCLGASHLRPGDFLRSSQALVVSPERVTGTLVFTVAATSEIRGKVRIATSEHTMVTLTTPQKAETSSGPRGGQRSLGGGLGRGLLLDSRERRTFFETFIRFWRAHSSWTP